MTPSFELTPRQRDTVKLLGGSQRHSMLVGGSRSGKTFLLVRSVLVRALRSPASRHAILRLRDNAVRRSIWMDTLPKVARLCFPGVKLEFRERDGYIRLPNGSEIWVGGLDDKERVERILGQEYATIYFNECSQIPWASVLIALTRLAQKCDGLLNRAYYDLNPTGTGHWTYRLFVEKRAPDSLQALPDAGNYAYAYLNPVDNQSNIDAEYLDSLRNLPERQRRRFFDGRYVAQIDGALWTLEMIEAGRISPEDVPELRRVVVAIDPSGAEGEMDLKADEIGIVAAGADFNGHGYVLEDASGLMSPEQWGARSCKVFHHRKADRIVGEGNFGGDMVRAVVHGADSKVPFSKVTASRGKVVRAEPMAALYERGLIHHAGRFPLLEDEQTNFSTSGYLGTGSPNRADALVWALTELFDGSAMFPEFSADRHIVR